MFRNILVISALWAACSAMAGVELNKATEADLDSVKGVGPATSKQILAERKKTPFKDWADLMSRTKGISEARASKLSAQGVTVNGHSFKDISPAAIVTDPKSGKPAKVAK